MDGANANTNVLWLESFQYVYNESTRGKATVLMSSAANDALEIRRTIS